MWHWSCSSVSHTMTGRALDDSELFQTIVWAHKWERPCQLTQRKRATFCIPEIKIYLTFSQICPIHQVRMALKLRENSPPLGKHFLLIYLHNGTTSASPQIADKPNIFTDDFNQVQALASANWDFFLISSPFLIWEEKSVDMRQIRPFLKNSQWHKHNVIVLVSCTL